ncbi:hypothetical protein CcI156_07645 [Frankia sp. CcI156]|nr:hypothetical protein CcI6DRAFT_00605 [Frankia sp. CcI6]KFB04350.1 hypothetical protein ALLO2DRAFT_02799 [Frankia sp. Allo2]ONH27706.1 hypothetical protein CcI156_07645 [Frankia sp. CcI156]
MRPRYPAVSGTDGLDRTQPFQSAHRPEPCFQPAVIGFDPVVLPGRVDVAGFGEQLVENPRVDRGLVGGDLDRPATLSKRPDEESPGSGLATAGAGQDVDDLPVLVNRPVQIGPPAGDLDVGLVDEPSVPGSVPTRPGRFGQQGRKALHPPVDSHVINQEAALGEQLLDIPVGQGVPQVPADSEDDHLRWEPEPRELRRRNRRTDTTSTHHSIMADQRPRCRTLRMQQSHREPTRLHALKISKTPAVDPPEHRDTKRNQPETM